jgi:DNA (cytosine-5)-methyltransferase 1
MTHPFTPACPPLKVLDLFCGAGGAAMGLHRAWPDAEIFGVDIKSQPRYPFTFVCADAMTYPLNGFDFVWASPPCQAHTALKTMWNAKPHADLISGTRDRLVGRMFPYVIENVPGAPLYSPIKLCGTMFDLGCKNPDAALRRHRLFECSFPVPSLSCRHNGVDTIGVYGGHHRNRRRTIGVHGEGCRDARRKFDKGVADFGVTQGREAMGIDWMTIAELCEAIPPAYSEFIARAYKP